jgi:hypothetical protein
MLRRLLPFVVALALAGAPLALAACQVLCASSMAHSAGAQTVVNDAPHDGSHACHDAAAGNGPLLSQAPHGCDHGGDEQAPAPGVAAAQGGSIAVPLALVAVSRVTLPAPTPTLTLWPTSSSDSLVPAGLRSAIPLRI